MLATVRQEDPHLARLRRCRRNPAADRPPALRAAGQQGVAQARRLAAGVLVQDSRRLQQADAVERRGARAWRGHRVGGQPCPGPGPGRQGAGGQGHHRDAQDHPRDQGRRRALAWRQGGAARRFVPGGPGLLAASWSKKRATSTSTPTTTRTPLPGRAPWPWRFCASTRAAGRDLRAGGRRRPDRRYCRLREIPAPGDQGHRRRAG